MRKGFNAIRFDMIAFQILIMIYLFVYGEFLGITVIIIGFIVTAANLIFILYELEKVHNLLTETENYTENVLLVDEEKSKSLKHIETIAQLYKSGTREDLLDYIERSQREYYDEEILNFDLEILNIILQRYITICNKKDIEFTYNIQANVKTLLNAAGLQGEELCTILGNILDNGIDVLMKKAEDRKLHVAIQGNGYEVLIKIRNNGEMMTEKVKEKLFNYGFSTKQESRGAGLFIVYKLLEKRHAKLTVTSTEVETVFNIVFDLEN